MHITGPHLQRPVASHLPSRLDDKSSTRASQDCTTPTQVAESDTTATQPQETKGVIRNILDGHYKGVADVRLRIVHYDELSALETAGLKAAASESIEQFLDSIGAAIDQIPEPLRPAPSEAPDDENAAEENASTVAELYQRFVQDVRTLADEFQTSEKASAGSLIDGVQNAFTALVCSLQGLLTPPASDAAETVEGDEGDMASPAVSEQMGTEENEMIAVVQRTPEDSPADEVPAVEESPSPAQTPLDYQILLDRLASAFAAALAEFRSALEQSSILPELSVPTGNGRAYEKFLAIYNDLWGIQPADSQTGNTQAIDAAL